jgi:isopentenyl phosphate kinase
MHTRPSSYDPRGVAVVHESMSALNQIIVNSMISHGIHPYSVQPSVFTSAHRPIPAKIRSMFGVARSKVVPVTFGDVIHFGGSKYSILSGDALMTIIAKVLRPSRVIFATNVDGIFEDFDSRTLIRELGGTSRGSLVKISDGAVADVTGGMRRKITEAFKIASSGMEVMMVNGLHPDRIVDAAAGKPTIGTLIRKRRSRS